MGRSRKIRLDGRTYWAHEVHRGKWVAQGLQLQASAQLAEYPVNCKLVRGSVLSGVFADIAQCHAAIRAWVERHAVEANTPIFVGLNRVRASPWQ